MWPGEVAMARSGRSPASLIAPWSCDSGLTSHRTTSIGSAPKIFYWQRAFVDPRRLTKVLRLDKRVIATSLRGIKSEATRPGPRDNRKSSNAVRICRGSLRSALNTRGLRKGRNGVGRECERLQHQLDRSLSSTSDEKRMHGGPFDVE